MVPTSTSSSTPFSNSVTLFITHASIGGQTTLEKSTFKLYSDGVLKFDMSFFDFL